MSGIVNHLSKPVALCGYGVQYLFASSLSSRKSSEFSHASREALSLNLYITCLALESVPVSMIVVVPR